jgi:hypothetical protein
MRPVEHSVSGVWQGRRVEVRPQRRSEAKARKAFSVAILAYAVIFALWQAEPVPWEVQLAGLALWAVSLYPLARWYAHGDGGLPMFELICLSYGLQFSNPLYLQPSQIVIKGEVLTLPWEWVLKAILLAMLGVSCLIGGYHLASRRGILNKLPVVDLPLSQKARSSYVWFGLVAGLLGVLFEVRGFRIGESLSALFGLVTNQFRVAVAILAYMVYRKRARSVTDPLVLYFAVALGGALGLVTGMLENAFVPLVLVIAVRWHVRGKVPLRLMTIAVVAFLVFNAVKSEYRKEAWSGQAELGVMDRLGLWLDLSGHKVRETTRGDTLENAETVLRDAMKRFDLLHKFAYVVEMTPDVVPYYEGRTYGYFVVALIPRFLWPGKPSASDANARIDIDYGFLYEQQRGKATIAIGQLPEAFANFGVLGVAVVMAIQGVLLGMANRVFNGPNSDGGRAIYLSFMVFLLNGVGTSTVMWFGALLQNFAANAVILRLFAKGLRAKPMGQPPSVRKPSSVNMVGVSGQRGVGAVVGPRK